MLLCQPLAGSHHVSVPTGGSYANKNAIEGIYVWGLTSSSLSPNWAKFFDLFSLNYPSFHTGPGSRTAPRISHWKQFPCWHSFIYHKALWTTSCTVNRLHTVWYTLTDLISCQRCCSSKDFQSYKSSLKREGSEDNGHETWGVVRDVVRQQCHR